MKVKLCYVFPNVHQKTYVNLARRFVRTYQENPPGEFPHDLVVVVNGAALSDHQRSFFSGLPVRFASHNNYGKDIGAFMSVAMDGGCDLLVCLGSHIYFHRAGWLDRMIDEYLRGGPGLYGCWGFNEPAAHIRTTCFWLPPELLASYPWPVDNAHRYNFEHGLNKSILRWTRQNDLPVTMVGWSMAFHYPHFASLPHREALVWDQHVDRSLPPKK